jgi:hypothetical protein
MRGKFTYMLLQNMGLQSNPDIAPLFVHQFVAAYEGWWNQNAVIYGNCVNIHGCCVEISLYIALNEWVGRWLSRCVFTNYIHCVRELYCLNHLNNQRVHK